MKSAIATFVLFFSVISHAQATPEMEDLAKMFCHGTWAKNSPERARMHDALEKIRPGIPSGHNVFYIAEDDAIMATAYTIRHIPMGIKQSVVCMPVGYIDFESNEGEIEFTLAHETGHAVDETCYGNYYQTHKTECERRADDIGFSILQKAGINPDVAVSLFKKKNQPDRIANLKQWKKFHPHPA